MLDNFLGNEQQQLLNETSFCENWLVDSDSICKPYFSEEEPIFPEPYRLYRFLTDLETVLASIPDDNRRIQAIIPLVRQLLYSSSWLHTNYIEPSPKVAWSVKMLYQEPDYPITVQTVAWLPGKMSPIHNHATWGIVALISGQEKNTFWRRSPDSQNQNRIEQVGEHILTPGDIIGFMPDAIHSVEPLGNEPTITFNIYGVTDFARRYEFDPVKHTAKNF
ncbi:putative metal-dependent enzyme of the double-stranded beta helix superfamily [Hyella patelloides LEGE 07179]|uniref:Putative metal-dependent enzyme of the double-stranded beta helix superfamily n=1 Tax=Hyella patelloides LEGE 07179 TaxID=945734 RepID=A0A563VS86_9CYAN|nr:cupin [Hyella patelloides]VEP14324.1 putative metal-dependent enzyme of the double-stranded beta helix superfamily [Hyella patelloides LEGE 07179]